jgi:transmembrane sensor
LFVDASERRKRASLEAAEWWVRLQEPDVSRAEREEFIDWLRESALHVAEMLRIAQVHGALEHFQQWTRLSTEGSDEPENVIALPQSVLKGEPDGEPLPPSSPAEERGAPGETTHKRYPRRGRFYALAASIVGLTLLGAWIFLGARTQTIETDRGERREVALADGSVLQVDPETRLRINFDEHTRGVALERGRALFRVAKNPDRPFLVQADGTTVRAVGTAFGVERDGEAVKITVSEGRVAVLPTSLPAVVSRSVQPFVQPSSPIVAHPAGLAEVRHARAGQSPSSKPQITGETKSADGADLKTGLGETDNYGTVSPGTTTPEIYLTAGQQLTVASTGTAEPVRKVDSDRELAWAKGRLVFDNEPLGAAIEEFNRYNRVQLHVVDEALAKRLVSAVFDASDPESFIAFIQTVAPVRVTRSDPMNITIATEAK